MTTPRIVGRAAELRIMHSFVEVAERDGGCLLVVGEAGIGKSLLLEDAAATATANGDRLLRAAGTEFEADISFAALNQLLLPAVRESALIEGPQTEPLRIALGLAAGPAPSYLSVSNAVLAVLHELAGRRPVLIIVDDVPDLDRSSAVVLGLVARRLTGLRVGLLMGQRTGDSGFFENAGMPEMVLAPLDDPASADLLMHAHPDLDPRTRNRVLAEAQGNPLALIELPADGYANDGEMPMSRRLQDLFASRVRRLPEPTRALLLLAALSGPADVRTVAGSSDAVEHLDAALQEGIIDVDRAGHVRFRHPLSRFAVIELATPAERMDAHRQLAGRSPDPVRRAWHLAESTLRPDEEVAATLERAAHIVRRRGDAVASVESLTRAAELSTDREARARRLADAATIGAELTGALGSAEELLDAANRAAPGSLELSVAAASVLLNRDCAVDTAHRLLTLALDGDGPVEHRSVCDALHLLLMVCWFGGRAALWEPFHAAMDRLDGDVPATLRISGATFSDPVRLARPVLPLLEAETHTLVRTYDPLQIIRLGVAAVYVDRIDDCRDALWRVVEDGRRGGAVSAALNAMITLSVDGWMRGRWDEAQRLVAEGLILCEKHGYQRYSIILGGYIGTLIRAARGGAGADEAADEMDRWATARGVNMARAFAHHVHSIAAQARGDFSTAYEHAVAVSPAGVLAPHMPHALWLVLDVVESAVRSGRRPQAQAHARVMRESGIRDLSPRLAMLVPAAEALVSDDLALFEQAVTTPGASQFPFELARVRLCYGEALRRARQLVAARRQLAAAVELFENLGAAPWARRAFAELRATGQPHAAPERLTGQETAIAHLAAAGMTNKDIAVRLGIAPATVAANLYRIFPKLGISSRAALRDALSARDHT
ncbi:AAA family ATPase [Actinoplanes sp. TBRC 11911]|uniref:helix-turn-helix transcriptional regulator n=1 Tax=Actinoplanes sp. TBRC 11911 TaxID=2729386 RepID=UPI00145F475A|nr:LuxR family transcriptional regulator [Actinoplanes sp. TBRC 11911]NMO57401.1 AAA family ATPase [Actinoplanes sp. TBRC 11911]